MKTILAVTLMSLSLSSFAEVCKSADYKFEISKKEISFSEHGGHVTKLKISVGKTVTSRYELAQFVTGMVSDTVSDSPLSEEVGNTITKVSMVGTEGNGDIVGMLFAKSYDKKGKLVARFMLSEGGYFRCL
jgi:hypothetical protein